MRQRKSATRYTRNIQRAPRKQQKSQGTTKAGKLKNNSLSYQQPNRSTKSTRDKLHHLYTSLPIKRKIKKIKYYRGKCSSEFV